MTRQTNELGQLATGQGTNGWVGRMGLWVVAVAVLCGGAATASATEAETVPVISSRHWKCQVTPDAAAKLAGRDAYEEYVFIEDDQVTAFELARLGFPPINPTIGVDSTGAITYTVSLKCNLQGTVVISGKLTSTTMSGTLKWTKDGKTYNYTFTGVPYTPAEDVES